MAAQSGTHLSTINSAVAHECVRLVRAIWANAIGIQAHNLLDRHELGWVPLGVGEELELSPAPKRPDHMTNPNHETRLIDLDP